jgi:hypothetical protein
MATAYNIAIDQGADWYLTVTYQNPAGTPVNLTGYTAALQIRQNFSDANAELTLTTFSGIVITPSTGTLAIHATAALTLAIGAGAYVYDIKITSSAGIVTRLTQGSFQVNAAVTSV